MTCECRRPASTTPVTVGEPRSISGPLHPESREQPCRILPICPLIPGPYLLDESSFTTQVPTFFCDQTGSSFAPCLTSPIPSSWKFCRQCFCNFLLVRGRSCCVRGHEPGHQLQDDLFRFAGTKCQSLASVHIVRLLASDVDRQVGLIPVVSTSARLHSIWVWYCFYLFFACSLAFCCSE